MMRWAERSRLPDRELSPLRRLAVDLAIVLALPVALLGTVERLSSRSPALLGLAMTLLLSTLTVVGGLAGRRRR